MDAMTRAVRRPTRRSNKFCTQPRKKSSSGTAVKKNIKIQRRSALPIPGRLRWGWMKPRAQAERDNDGSEEDQFSQAGFPVTPVQMKIEADSAQLPDGQKSVQAGIDQK